MILRWGSPILRRSRRSCFRTAASSPELPHAFSSGDGHTRSRRLRRLVAFVEKLVHRDLQRLGPFLQCFDGGDGVAILDGRKIRAEQARALFNFPLRQFLFFAELAEPFANNHCESMSLNQQYGKQAKRFTDGRIE